MKAKDEIAWAKSQLSTLDYSVLNVVRDGTLDELREMYRWLEFIADQTRGLRMILRAHIDLHKQITPDEVMP